MTASNATRDERDRLLREYRAAERRFAEDFDQWSREDVRREDKARQVLLQSYSRCLPEVSVSRCPFTGRALAFPFDIFGLDGMWWASDGVVPARRVSASHFRLVLGAIDFHGREPHEAASNGRVLPGPGAPFVVPRLLEDPAITCVSSSLALPHGDTAYVMAYFSSQVGRPGLAHQSWARETFSGVDEDGNEWWSMATDPWDFDLERWIRAGRLQWIEPDDPTLTLKQAGRCPYLALPGVRAPQCIESGRVVLLPPPDGQPADPFG